MTSPTLPATLPERLYLPTYDRGRERLTARTWAGYLLRAGALAESRSRGLVQERDGSSPIARVDENDAALVALAAVGQLRAAISKSQAREYAGRIAALAARTEPIAGALRHTVRSAKSAAASG